MTATGNRLAHAARCRAAAVGRRSATGTRGVITDRASARSAKEAAQKNPRKRKIVALGAWEIPEATSPKRIPPWIRRVATPSATDFTMSKNPSTRKDGPVSHAARNEAKRNPLFRT
ncbi:hypothetical protein GCM10009753_46120 [Streptantibioticus ferralitis]